MNDAGLCSAGAIIDRVETKSGMRRQEVAYELFRARRISHPWIDTDFFTRSGSRTRPLNAH